MKKICFFALAILLTGCMQNKVTRNKQVADVVANMYGGVIYKSNDFNTNERKMLKSFYDELQNPIVDLEEFASYYGKTKVKTEDTFGTYKDNDNCYIRYNDIYFEEVNDESMGERAYIVCGGYEYTVLKQDVLNYESIIENPKFQYFYIGYFKDENYKFVYRSLQDNTALVVEISGSKIKTSFGLVDDYNLKTSIPNSGLMIVLETIFVIAGTIAIIYIIKKYKENKD